MSRSPQENRCPYSDLYRNQCGHCRGTKPQPPVFLEAEPELVEDRPSHAVGFRTLNRASICDICSRTLKVGSPVTLMNDDTYQCSECRPT